MRDFFEQYLNNDEVLKRFRGIGALFENQTFTSLEVKVSGEVDPEDIPTVYEHPSGKYEVRFVSVNGDGERGREKVDRERPRVNAADDILDELDEDEAGKKYVPAKKDKGEDPVEEEDNEEKDEEIDLNSLPDYLKELVGGVGAKGDKTIANDQQEEVDEFDPAGENAMPKLERIIISQYDPVVPTAKVADLKRYAIKLWKYSAGKGVNPVFMSVQPDNYRIVVKVDNDDDRENLEQYLKGDTENFRIQPSNIDRRDEIYSTEAGREDYEVRVGINEQVTLA